MELFKAAVGGAILAQVMQVNIVGLHLSTNDVLAVYINTTNSRGAIVECTFHPVYNCSIDYGSYRPIPHQPGV